MSKPTLRIVTCKAKDYAAIKEKVIGPDTDTGAVSYKLWNVTTKVRNPWAVKEFRKLTGQHEDVKRLLNSCKSSYNFIESSIISSYILGYSRPSVMFMICPSGKWQSVAVAELVAERLAKVATVDLKHYALEKQS